MGVIIENGFNILVPVAISYGLDLQLKYTDVVDPVKRYKMGVHVTIDGTFVGDMEIDFSVQNQVYTIPVGEVIKGYIQKGDIPGGQEGIVSDSGASVAFQSYVVIRTGHTWAAPVNGELETAYCVRGVHYNYYLRGDDTPKIPTGSRLLESSTGSMTVVDGSSQYLYVDLLHNTTKYNSMIGDIKRYDASGLVSTTAFSLSGKNFDSTMAYVYVGTHDDTNIYTYATLVYRVNQYNQSDDSLVYTGSQQVYDIKYICNPGYDFMFDLMYIDSSFNWATIPFYTKGESSLNRTSTTIEGYDYTKRDFNVKVRRTLTLKSDYMDKALADDTMLFGVTPEITVKYPDNATPKTARLLNSSVEMISGGNQPMSQIEIEVELGALTLTP